MTVSSEQAVPGSARNGKARGGRPTMSAVVQRTQQLSPSMVRVVLGGPGLADFTPNEYSDAYVKLVFLRPGVEYPRPLDLNAVRQQLPAADLPKLRTYTVRAWDPSAQELTIDFVVHGDAGLAGPWALGAKPGDELDLVGPGGSFAANLLADWHLLIGDESALPAIASSLERLPDTAVGHVLLEVEDTAHEQPLPAPPGVRVQWVHHGSRPLGEALLAAVTELPFPAGEVHAFVHGEAGVVKELRRLLKLERGIPMADLSISGYWRLGADDETWRAAKADWNREIEQAESTAKSHQ